MADHRFPNWHASIRVASLRALFVGIALLAAGVSSDTEASRYTERTIEFANLPGWDIVARDSGMCSARQREENGQSITLFADPNTYRGGVWFLGVESRNHRLKSGVLETVARLSLDGTQVVTGKALEVGSWVGHTRTETYVRVEFLAIDAHIDKIEAAREVEAQADGLSPLKLGPLSPIIAAIRKCQLDSSEPGFWKPNPAFKRDALKRAL